MIPRCLVAMLIAASATAADGSPPADPPKPAGAEPIFVDHVEGSRIFVKIFGGDESVATEASTVITIEGKPAVLGDLRKGDHIIHLLAEHGHATLVEVAREKPAGEAPKAK